MSMSTPEFKGVAVIPYVQGLSESVRCILTPLQIRAGFRPFLTLQQLLSKPKDMVPALQQSGVVCKIPCAKCPKVYIGQTRQRLSQRLTEHKRAVKSADFNSSVLAEHKWSAGHPVDWEKAWVVSNWYTRLSLPGPL